MVKRKTVITNWEQLPVVLDTEKVAQIFGVTISTVKSMCYRNDIKGTKFGKKWVFSRDYIRSLIEQA